MRPLCQNGDTATTCSCCAGVQNLVTKGYKKISPFFIPYSITNMGGALLAIDQVGLEGKIAGAEGNGQAE